MTGSVGHGVTFGIGPGSGSSPLAAWTTGVLSTEVALSRFVAALRMGRAFTRVGPHRPVKVNFGLRGTTRVTLWDESLAKVLGHPRLGAIPGGPTPRAGSMDTAGCRAT